MSTVLYEPIGVVGCISPWNYPLLMALWKIVPSLAAGNSTILKPAEQSPLSCYRVAELFVEAGGPPGALQVVNGLGEEAGQALARHMDVSKISFTGLNSGRSDPGKSLKMRGRFRPRADSLTEKSQFVRL